MGTCARTTAGARTARAAEEPRNESRRERQCVRWRSSGALAQQREQPLERLPAMADAVLLQVSELRRGDVAAFDDEQRIVAESARAARCPRDRPEPAPLGDERLGVCGVPQQHDHAYERRLTCRGVFEHPEQLRIVARITLLAVAL